MEAHTPLIRAAISSDAAVLGQLGAALVAVHHKIDRERFLEATSGTASSYASWLERKSKAADAVVLVAEVDGTVIGYVCGTMEGADYMALRGPAGVVHDLIVDTAHRREGIGRKLLEAVVAEFEKRGVPRIVLSTAVGNEAAQGLFASMGFKPTMVEMTRDLASKSGLLTDDAPARGPLPSAAP